MGRAFENRTKPLETLPRGGSAGRRLLKDLKARGLLESTLVLWGGEFGRTPMSEKGDGRDHNPTGFTMWMAGGGSEEDRFGETDELGLHAVKDGCTCTTCTRRFFS